MLSRFHALPIFAALIILSLLAGCSAPATPTAPLPSTQKVAESTLTAAVLATPQPTTTELYEGSLCAYTSGTVKEISMPSKLLTRPLEIKVYLPPCYSETRNPGYPVLYMLHGQTYGNDQWVRLGLLAKADELITAGTVTPMIIVLPYEMSWTVGPEESSFDETFIQELIPFIDETYNGCAERSCRAIGGLSRGGNWAVYLGFSHPEEFAAIGAHSAPLFYGEIQRITAVLQTKGAVSTLPAIYIDAGNRDENISQVLAYVDLFKKYNVPYTFTEFTGYHAEEYWSAHTGDYLQWYSAQFPSLGK
jgi:enterochelin esterase-like enzyme